eukprot:5437886-Lingulodinium_polyedra.AAC.1
MCIRDSAWALLGCCLGAAWVLLPCSKNGVRVRCRWHLGAASVLLGCCLDVLLGSCLGAICRECSGPAFAQLGRGLGEGMAQTKI